jgi:hypothetical protein
MLLTARSSIGVDCAPEVAFDRATDPAMIARHFTGFGVIPAIHHADVVGHDPTRVGSIRRLVSASGVIVTEAVVEHDRPRRHCVELLGLLHGPVSWMVRWFRGEWEFEPRSGGTRVTWTLRLRMTNPVLLPAGVLGVHLFLRPAMRRCLVGMRDEFASQPVRAAGSTA